MIGIEQWRASIGLYHSGSNRQLAHIPEKSQPVLITVQNSSTKKPQHTVTDTEQSRTSIELYHSGSYRQLAHISEKRQLATITVYQLLVTLVLVLILAELLASRGPLFIIQILVNGYSFHKGGTMTFKKTSGTQLLVSVCAIGLAVMEAHSGSLERSVRAMAILLIMAGDVEQNPGPLPPASASPESRALHYHSTSLIAAIADPVRLSWMLVSAGIIDMATKDKANLPTMTTVMQNDALLSAVTSRVDTDPSIFCRFVDLLKNDEDNILKILGGKLEDIYNEFTKGDTKQLFPSHPHPSQPVSTSPESRALRHHHSSLITAIADPLKLSWMLFSAGLIEKATMDQANLPEMTTEKKNSILMSAVISRVSIDPSLFHQFVKILKDDEYETLKSLGGKLEETYYEFTKGEQHTQSQPVKQLKLSLPASANPESRALYHHSASMVAAIPDPIRFSWKLFAVGIIDTATKDRTNHSTTTSTINRNSALLTAMMHRVETEPSLFHQFVGLLKYDGDDILKLLGEKLEDTYNEFAKGDTKQCILEPQFIQQSPSSKTLQPPVLTPPALEQPALRSLVHQPQTLEAKVSPPPMISDSQQHGGQIKTQSLLMSLPHLSTSASLESRVLHHHSYSLIIAQTARADPLLLTQKLFSAGIIERATFDKIFLLGMTIEKMDTLLSAVMSRVDADPSLFHQFVDLLKGTEDTILKSLGGILEDTYNEFTKGDTEQCTLNLSPAKQPELSPSHIRTYHPSQLPPQSPHSQPSHGPSQPPPLPNLDPYNFEESQMHLPHSQPPHFHLPPMKHLSPPTVPQSFLLFVSFLRSFYDSDIPLSYCKWPPIPKRKYISLAAINREKVTSEELKEFMLAALYGDIEQILMKTVPVRLQEILNTEQGETLRCVLVEGAPGVGKTTLSWEICKKWGRGELFQQYTAVLLLKLRDRTVQNAKNIMDLIYYMYGNEDESSTTDILQHMIHTKGKNILIILDGLNELPRHLLDRDRPSIFTRLLSRIILPNATILVTSRPSATAQLRIGWEISRHIEVLGFVENNITEYIQSVLSPQDCPAFDNYLTINPYIRFTMYIPLNCAIVVEVYRSCQQSGRPPPKTTTELYTCLVQVILLRFFDNYPDYKDDAIAMNKFTDLPPPVYQHFYKLIQMAYDGVQSQQLTFYDLDTALQHLGFMDSVMELFSRPTKYSATYSYNFLSLSLQEYLAAYFISLESMDVQQQLLPTICHKQHLRNMGRFLAGITKYQGMDRATVKAVIEHECKKGYNGTLILSPYTLQLLHESGEYSIIDGHPSYKCRLTDYGPLLDFAVLGHCITNTSYKWTLQLGSPGDYMQSTDRIAMLIQTLKSHSNPSYTIECIHCCYDALECVQCLLLELPQHALQYIQELVLVSNICNPCPLPLPVLEFILSKMSRLHTLRLRNGAISTTGAVAMAELIKNNSTLKVLDLSNSHTGMEGMEALKKIGAIKDLKFIQPHSKSMQPHPHSSHPHHHQPSWSDPLPQPCSPASLPPVTSSQQHGGIESPFKQMQIQVKEQMKLLPSIMPDTLHPALPDSCTKFIDPVEIIHCDSSGGVYHNPWHGVTLRIPEGAIPHGDHLDISIGVGLYGDFNFPKDLSPVSAIVWLCSETKTTFLKPIQVIIPHFLDCTCKQDAKSLKIQFLKASHWSSTDETIFYPADGEIDFTSFLGKGILHTQHLCYLCIGAGISPEQLKSRRFCIACAVPQSITTGSVVYFYVLYFLETCIESLEKKLPEGYSIKKKRVFKFLGDNITGEYQCSPDHRPMTVTLEKKRISQDMTDFWKLHQSGELKLLEKSNLYPPNMEMTFGNLSSCEEQVVTVLFRGTQEPVEQMMIIVPGSIGSSSYSSVHSESRPMQDVPTIRQLLLMKTVPEGTPVRIIQTLAPQWEDLGLMIDFDPEGSHVRSIKKEHGIEGPVPCCKKVFMDWRNGKGAYQPPTWENLLNILEDMEYTNLAMTLHKLFST